MDLEMGVTRAVAALEVASPDSKRENRAETMKRLEDQAQVRDLALGLRQEHLNWQLNPSDRSGPSRKNITGKLQLDAALEGERSQVMEEHSEGTQWRDARLARDSPEPIAPLMSPTLLLKLLRPSHYSVLDHGSMH